MLPLATAHIAHLWAKAHTGGWGFKPSSLLIQRRPISFKISPSLLFLYYSNKLLLYSHINTKYLITVNNFFVI